MNERVHHPVGGTKRGEPQDDAEGCPHPARDEQEHPLPTVEDEHAHRGEATGDGEVDADVVEPAEPVPAVVVEGAAVEERAADPNIAEVQKA